MEGSVSVKLSNFLSDSQFLSTNNISINIPGRKLTIPRQLFTVCDGNLAECIMTQLKMNIKIHLHHINGCNRKKKESSMQESITKCKQYNYVGPYK